MDNESHEPQTPALAVRQVRHDGWNGESVAAFLETLAETGVVIEAANAARKSANSAYALRRRDPLFAAAWEAALGRARERLADTLLARSLEGNVEQIIKDGELVAEKHYLDNRLALAVLKRLDQRAEGRSPNAPVRGALPAVARPAPDWELALTALRSGEADDIGAALAMLEGDETHEPHDPPFVARPCEFCGHLSLAPGGGEIEPEPEDDHCWEESGEWWTDFPPPPGFTGIERGEWGRTRYQRHCTDDELALLAAEQVHHVRLRLVEAEAERESWFAELRDELAAEGAAPLVEEVRAMLSAEE